MAIAAANACAQVLKQDFGATDVIIFGSLRGDTPWHWNSDIDLAVRGMSEDAIWKAWGRLEKVVPGWLKFDLVDVDDVPERVRARILEQIPLPNNPYLALSDRIEDEMAAIAEVVVILEDALTLAKNAPSILVTPALASYIVDFYSGCERIAERVAVSLDGGLPQGENWHEQLLNQMAVPGGMNRPALWEPSLRAQLDNLRRFRHVVRHRYHTGLRGDRILELAQQVQPLFAEIAGAIARFQIWLTQQEGEDRSV